MGTVLSIQKAGEHTENGKYRLWNLDLFRAILKDDGFDSYCQMIAARHSMFTSILSFPIQ